jgi:ankyrin repeat protein
MPTSATAGCSARVPYREIWRAVCTRSVGCRNRISHLPQGYGVLEKTRVSGHLGYKSSAGFGHILIGPDPASAAQTDQIASHTSMTEFDPNRSIAIPDSSHSKCGSGSVDVVKLFLERHANVVARDDAGRTALESAVQRENSATARLLRSAHQ